MLRGVAGHQGTTGPTDEHDIHLPGPSLSPPLLGLAVAVLAFGVLYGLPLVAAGFAIFLIGLVLWLVDDARAYARASDEGHH